MNQFYISKLEKVIEYYIGNIIHYEAPKVNQEILIEIYNFSIENEKFNIVTNKYTKEVQISTMITNITEMDERNKFICGIIEKTRAVKERKVLILSDRRDHLDLLQEEINKLDIGSTSQYVGGLKQKILDEAEHADIIFSTYSMNL